MVNVRDKNKMKKQVLRKIHDYQKRIHNLEEKIKDFSLNIQKNTELINTNTEINVTQDKILDLLEVFSYSNINMYEDLEKMEKTYNQKNTNIIECLEKIRINIELEEKMFHYLKNFIHDGFVNHHPVCYN